MKLQVVKVAEAIAQDISGILQGITQRNSLFEISAKATVDNNVNPVVKVAFTDYVNYKESGRRVSSEDFPSLDNVRDWALEKGIGTDNKTLWAVSDAMRNTGQSVYPLLSVLESSLEENFNNKRADRLFDVLAKEVELLFTK